MQTFMPYNDFVKSAQMLDYRRLGKQRVECKQILLALTEPSYGWKHHPATKMWAGYEPALCAYASVICNEWMSRGYEDSLLLYFAKEFYKVGGRSHPTSMRMMYDMPHWMGDEAFHHSHRMALRDKEPRHYEQFGWTGTNTGYVWPTGRPAPAFA